MWGLVFDATRFPRAVVLRDTVQAGAPSRREQIRVTRERQIPAEELREDYELPNV